MQRLFVCLAVCLSGIFATANVLAAGSFGDDLAFLRQHTKVIVLSDTAGHAQLTIAPAWQGRVMTSTDGGGRGHSYGWINRELIASGKPREHINAFGGEDRFWIGPEGGQFSVFFAPGVPFDFAHWFTPAALDTEPFAVLATARDRARVHRDITLVNYSGTKFHVGVDREVRLLGNKDAWRNLGLKPDAHVSLVAYESINRLTNAGREPWREKTGLLSIWILGMFNAAPTTTIVVPLRPGTGDNALTDGITSDYFGPVPASRLKIHANELFFCADGRYRSKIGVAPSRARPLLGSYDSAGGVLTLVQYTLPKQPAKYVNAQWKLQENPFAGDVANSYSDDGKLGAFYEMESSSPAAALAPGKTLEHVHRTLHLRGAPADLDPIARRLLGVSLEQIQTALR
jgi:hypothetical protein